MTIPNPFVRYGTMASDDRFVGRESERASLRRRLYEASSSAALIGLTRIGKSSLANEILKEAPEGTWTGWVSLAEVRSGAEALKDILAICPPETALSATFTSGDPKIVSVDKSGIVHPVKDGQTTLTVEVNEPIGGTWQMIRSSHPWKKSAAWASSFTVPVGADAAAVVKYRVRVTY